MHYDERHDVFISYSHLDVGNVQRFQAIMVAYGYNVWRDDDRIGFGESIRAKVDEGLRTSGVTCFWVTENWKQSKFCNDELDEVYNARQAAIIILSEGVAPPGMFAGKKYIRFDGDLVTLSYKVHDHLVESSTGRVALYRDLIGRNQNVETAASALQRMVQLYKSTEALDALCDAMRSDALDLTNLDYCFRHFHIIFRERVGPPIIEKSKYVLNEICRSGSDNAIDKAAYSIGEIYKFGADEGMRDWAAKRIIALARRKDLVGEKMRYTKKRVQL